MENSLIEHWTVAGWTGDDGVAAYRSFCGPLLAVAVELAIHTFLLLLLNLYLSVCCVRASFVLHFFACPVLALHTVVFGRRSMRVLAILMGFGGLSHEEGEREPGE